MAAVQPAGTVPVMPPFFRRVIPLMGLLAILSVIFTALIFVLDPGSYHVLGNCLEIGAALFCMVCCLYTYRYISDRVCLPLAAFAFLTYALANTYWFLYSEEFGRSFVFTTVSEFGFISFFLFFIAAIALEFPDRGLAFPAAAGLFILFCLFPVLFIISGQTCSRSGWPCSLWISS